MPELEGDGEDGFSTGGSRGDASFTSSAAGAGAGASGGDASRKDDGVADEHALHVLAMGDDLVRACVDCGRRTGNFCETMLQCGHVYWQGEVCLGVRWIPTERWAEGQVTPLCTACENR